MKIKNTEINILFLNSKNVLTLNFKFVDIIEANNFSYKRFFCISRTLSKKLNFGN